MIIPIRCFTCGKVLADKYNYYLKEVKKLEQEQEKKKPQQDDAQHFDPIRTGPIMDRLGLTRYCCRRHMLGTVDMMEII